MEEEEEEEEAPIGAQVPQIPIEAQPLVNSVQRGQRFVSTESNYELTISLVSSRGMPNSAHFPLDMGWLM
ncbi:MAG: hypothetical protein LBS83_03760 [Holosporales bacterium]|jgi:hypothetical protein|nr:hypothetical protein [Holosporales bacterium]